MNRMKMAAGLMVLVGLAVWSGLSSAADEKKEGGDKHFVKKASAAGMAEVNLSNLAVTRGHRAEVKQFARRMIADHGRANRELLGLANSKGLIAANTMDEKHKKLFEKLSTMDGPAFDHAYMEGMVKDHEEAVKLFEKESKDGEDEALKSWAGKTLSVLKMHLETAQKICKLEKEKKEAK